MHQDTRDIPVPSLSLNALALRSRFFAFGSPSTRSGTVVLNFCWCAVFPRSARKNRTHMIEKYRAAAGNVVSLSAHGLAHHNLIAPSSRDRVAAQLCARSVLPTYSAVPAEKCEATPM